MFFNFLLLVLTLESTCFADLTCKDQNGKAIDWFTLYKMPSISSNANRFVKIGQGYAYITNASQKSNWTLSSLAINDPASLHGYTLKTIFTTDDILNKSQIGYLMYNDGLTTSSSYAHAKGVLFWDNTTVVWLIHSFPDYPSVRSPNSSIINKSQLIYGQSMMCLTLNIGDLGKIVSQLLVIRPYVYDSFISTPLKSNTVVQPILKNLTSLINKVNVNTKSQPKFSIQNLTTKNGNQFIAFHKNQYFNDDLYAALVSPQINENVYAETWQNDPNPLSANCSVANKFVYNVNNIYFKNSSIQFNSSSDHSKWCLSYPTPSTIGKLKFTCIGDINRSGKNMSGQFLRGGGTVCFSNNINVWNSYQSVIYNFKACNGAIVRFS